MLARIYGFIGEEALTLEYAHKALELDPDLGSAYAWISLMYSRTGRSEEALQYIEQAFQRSPTDLTVLSRYGQTLAASGRGEQGISVLERVIELDSANYLAYSNLSWARWYAGDRDTGIVAMRRALELTPDRFNIHRSLGMMEAALGNRAEGVAQVQLAERLNSNLQPSVLTAYGYRVVGLHDDATRVARAWAETLEELPQGDLLFVLYHLVLDEEEQALDAFVQLIENPPGPTVPTMWVMNNAFDDPTLEKPEFAVLRAELRAKIGWN